MSDHLVGISVEQLCTCDQSSDCMLWPSVVSFFSCCTDTKDHCFLHLVSFKHGYEKGIMSHTSVYTPCQFPCLYGSRVMLWWLVVSKLVRKCRQISMW